MFTIFKNLNLKGAILYELLPMISSMLLVNAFLHLGSFIMEASIFLVLWYVQSGLINAIKTFFLNK